MKLWLFTLALKAHRSFSVLVHFYQHAIYRGAVKRVNPLLNE
jgi:hypothetical protein